MKKIFITLAIIVAVFLAIPLVGNKVIEQTINNRVEVLTSYGLKVVDSKTESSYLSTKKHFIFKVENSKSFVEYLNNFSDAQLPPFTGALVDGAEIGFDVSYSNIAIDDAISVDIYPYSLSKKIEEELSSENKNFFIYLEKLLKSRSLNYHINYDVLNQDFDGYIKDIAETQTLADKSKLSVTLEGATFSGQGLLLAPDALVANIKKVKVLYNSSDVKLSYKIFGFKSSSVFESKTTYASTMSFKNIRWSVVSTKELDTSLTLDNLAVDFSSNTQSVKADFYAKFGFDAMSITTKDTKINLEKFNYDVALRNVSKERYEALMSLLNEAKIDSSEELQVKIENSLIDLVSRGMVLDIADFSIQELSTAKTKNLGAMSLKSQITFKQDSDLATKIQQNPILLLEDIDMDIFFKMHKNMYSRLTTLSPVVAMAQNFAKDVNNTFVFDVKLKDSKLSVNGQEIR